MSPCILPLLSRTTNSDIKGISLGILAPTESGMIQVDILSHRSREYLKDVIELEN